MLPAVVLTYSDDPVAVTLDIWAAERAEEWTLHMGPRGANILMADKAEKKELSVSLKWIGGRVLTTALLGFVPADKRVKAVADLTAKKLA